MTSSSLNDQNSRTAILWTMQFNTSEQHKELPCRTQIIPVINTAKVGIHFLHTVVHTQASGKAENWICPYLIWSFWFICADISSWLLYKKLTCDNELPICYKQTKKNNYIQVESKLFHLCEHVMTRRAGLHIWHSMTFTSTNTCRPSKTWTLKIWTKSKIHQTESLNTYISVRTAINWQPVQANQHHYIWI